jgi:hypothetical protein
MKEAGECREDISGKRVEEAETIGAPTALSLSSDDSSLNVDSAKSTISTRIKRKLSSPFRAVRGEYDVSGTILAVMLVIFGLVFVLFGHKLFKPILFIAGFYVAGMFLLI